MACTSAPPFPESPAAANTGVAVITLLTKIEGIVLAVRASILYVSASTYSVISYSWFNTSATILPPRLAAPENVTKSPFNAPCAVSETVIVASLLATLAKVTALLPAA